MLGRTDACTVGEIEVTVVGPVAAEGAFDSKGAGVGFPGVMLGGADTRTVGEGEGTSVGLGDDVGVFDSKGASVGFPGLTLGRVVGDVEGSAVGPGVLPVVTEGAFETETPSGRELVTPKVGTADIEGDVVGFPGVTLGLADANNVGESESPNIEGNGDGFPGVMLGGGGTTPGDNTGISDGKLLVLGEEMAEGTNDRDGIGVFLGFPGLLLGLADAEGGSCEGNEVVFPPMSAILIVGDEVGLLTGVTVLFTEGIVEPKVDGASLEKRFVGLTLIDDSVKGEMLGLADGVSIGCNGNSGAFVEPTMMDVNPGINPSFAAAVSSLANSNTTSLIVIVVLFPFRNRPLSKFTRVDLLSPIADTLLAEPSRSGSRAPSTRGSSEGQP